VGWGSNFSKKKSAQKFLEIFRDTNNNPHKNNNIPLKRFQKTQAEHFNNR
jgi:hypothetical protein